MIDLHAEEDCDALFIGVPVPYPSNKGGGLYYKTFVKPQ